MSVALVGLGYVGLPLVVAFAESGRDATRRDRDRRRLAQAGCHPRGGAHCRASSMSAYTMEKLRTYAWRYNLIPR